MARLLSNTSPVLRMYAESRGTEDLESAVRNDCTKLVADQHQLPIRLDHPSILSQQNIEDIRFVDISFDGRIYPGGRGFIIEVNDKVIPTRQNFTIAHEIGHTLFLPFEVNEQMRCRDTLITARSKHDYEERLCDIAASELLMPLWMFKHFMWEWGVSIEAILCLSQIFQASLSATARRFIDVAPHNVVVACWRLDETGENEYVVDWFRGSPASQRFLLRYMPPRDASILNAAWRTSEVVTDKVDLGFLASLRHPIQERVFTQAFAYSPGQKKRILTLTNFEATAEALAIRYDASKLPKRVKQPIEQQAMFSSETQTELDLF